MGFDSEMHDPKSFRYLDLSKGNSASGSSFRQTICGSGIRRDTKVCGGNTGMDKKSRAGPLGVVRSPTALSLIHHLIKRIAERLCRPTVHFVQANLRYLVRLSTKRMRMVATCARVALP